MPSTLDQLPFDVLFGISHYLHLEDVFSLGSTCKQLRTILDESTLSRQVLENSAPFTTEAVLARNSTISYPDALRRLYKRRRAFSTGVPAAVCRLGFGSDFLYDNGIVCLLRRHQIHFYDLLSSRTPFTIEFREILRAVPGRHSKRPRMTLLSFNDDIVTLLYEDHDAGQDWLLAIDVKNRRLNHAMEPKALISTSRLFVRHTRDMLYYGTHSATGSHGHKEWILQGIIFGHSPVHFPAEAVSQGISGGANEESVRIQLYDFPGMDIGATVVFKIHNGFFYALSNCSAFDVVEVDWTSFFHIRRFPLNEPPVTDDLMEKNRRIYRRQHWEGPVNDSWTDLSLQVDERTNELMIVEARKEWQEGASSQTRTFYIHEISFEEESQGPKVPENDPFGPLSTSESNYAPYQERLPWQVHPENGHTCSSRRHSSPNSFHLAWTKFRTYNLSARAFIDIVTDPDCCGRGTHCIRIRAGSRCESPQDLVRPEDTSSKSGKAKAPQTELDISCPTPAYSLPWSEASSPYRYSPIYLWPGPSDYSPRMAKAHDLLNLEIPEGKNKAFYGGISIKAMADERSIVYLIKDSSKGRRAEGKLVCICFDSMASICAHNELDGEPIQSMDIGKPAPTPSPSPTAMSPPSSPGPSKTTDFYFHDPAVPAAGSSSNNNGAVPGSSGTYAPRAETKPQTKPGMETEVETEVDAEMLRRYAEDFELYERPQNFDDLWMD